MHEHRCPNCGAWSYWTLYLRGATIPDNIVGCDHCLPDEESDLLTPVEEWEVDWDW